MNTAAARRRGVGQLALVIVGPLLGLAAAGCGAGPRASPIWASPPGVTPAPSGAAAPGPTRAPEDFEVRGVLVVGDGAGVPGALGTWVLDDAGSDSPWLPWSASDAIAIPPGVTVALRLADGSPMGAWFADLTDAVDVDAGKTLRLSGREADTPPLRSVRLESLPVGRWVLAARLFRADGRGNGVTYWSVLVGR